MLKYYVIANKSIKIVPKNDVNYVYPLKDFCVGYIDEYQIDEIKEEAYLLINRLLNTEDITKLQKILDNLPVNIVGIFFEDLGVYELIRNLNIKSILYASHACCNYKTINTYLTKVDSVVISPDITKEEVKEILNKTTKPLIIYGLGHLPLMYSRRTLNTNYAKHFNYPKEKVLELEEEVTKMPFFTVENQYGTVIYDKDIYNASILKNEKNIEGVILNSFNMAMEVDELINTFLNNLKGKEKFLNQKTVYKLKEL